MSSPTQTPRRTPRRTTPRRTPLQERSSSQKNEAAGRLHRDSKQELTDAEIFSATPFPTKPQHILLPSTIRKQRSGQNVENELPNVFFNRSLPEVSTSATEPRGRQEERRMRRAPNLQLKRSVSALRDMYEAQAETSRPSTAVRSRPSTAAPSPALRPISSRLRSISSSEGLAGRSAWEMLGLPKVSDDDLAILPTLSESVAQHFSSEQSFASRVRHQAGTSSPNFETFGTSSPNLPTYQNNLTSSDPFESSSGSEARMPAISSPNVVEFDHSSSVMTTDPTGMSSAIEERESSPNFVQLHHDTSIITTDPTALSLQADEGESSPNLVKLGTSSPKRSSSPTPSQTSTGSRKRKRSELEGAAYAGRTPLFFGTRREREQASSPPVHNIGADSDASLHSSAQRAMHSSPPEIGSAQSRSQPTSSPVIRMNPARFSGDSSSIASAHTNLQAVLSSSPGPPVHRPIVRAPDINQFEHLAQQKRNTSGQSTVQQTTGATVSPVPSPTDVETPQLSSGELPMMLPRRSASRLSVFTEELDDNLDTQSIIPAQAYLHHQDRSGSQVNIISDADQHEATDELSALPRDHSSFAAALSHARSASFLASSSSSSMSRLESLRTSLDERMQSMRSFTHTRNNSSRSFRPGSSGSHLDASSVPTWARRYYSGFYQNSFQYLYQSSSNLAYPVINLPPPTTQRPLSVPASLPGSSSYETISSKTRSRSNLRNSWTHSVRSSMRSFIAPVLPPMVRNRLNVRDSHNTAGIGPLVSNPTRPRSEVISRPSSVYYHGRTIRHVSMPLSAVDPRFHWRGVVEQPVSPERAEKVEDYENSDSPRYSSSSSFRPPFHPYRNHFMYPPRFMRLSTPHLHRDRRLNTGSEASQGFGAPYNSRPKWQPTSGFNDELGRPSWFKVDIRDMQVICFLIGFLCPIAWFVGSFMPLPPRPSNYDDLEKHRASAHLGRFNDQDEFEEGDIIARLRLEKHLRGLEEVKWQNARWWRRMNRWMCCVGLVVLVIVIVLAIIGTKGHFSHTAY